MTKNPMLRYLLGEADDLQTTAEAPPPRVDAGDAPPAENPTPVVPADDEDGVDGNTVVNDLASAWESGSQMDVANRLMYTPISYSDFVKVLYMIGQDGATELGRLLDELAAGAENGEQDVSPLVRQAAGPEPEAPTEPPAGEEGIPDEAEEQRP
jgi:hypothetical protein